MCGASYHVWDLPSVIICDDVAKDPSDRLSLLTSAKSYFSESRYSARYFPANIPWPMTLCGVVGREQPVHSLAPLARLVGTFLLGSPLLGPSPMCLLSLPGYMLTCLFDSCCDLGLVDSGSIVCLFGKKFFDILEVH